MSKPFARLTRLFVLDKVLFNLRRMLFVLTLLSACQSVSCAENLSNTEKSFNQFTNSLRYVLDPEIIGTEAMWDHMEFKSNSSFKKDHWRLDDFKIVNQPGKIILSAQTLAGTLSLSNESYLLFENSLLGPAAMEVLKKWFSPTENLGTEMKMLDLDFLWLKLSTTEGQTELSWKPVSKDLLVFELKEAIAPYLTFSFKATLETNQVLHPSHWFESRGSNQVPIKTQMKEVLAGNSLFSGALFTGLKEWELTSQFSSQNLSTFRLAAELGLTNGLIPFILYQPVIPKQLTISSEISIESQVKEKEFQVKVVSLEVKPLLKLKLNFSFQEVNLTNRLKDFSLGVEDLGLREVIWTLGSGLWGCDLAEAQARNGVVIEQMLVQLEGRWGRSLQAMIPGIKEFVSKKQKKSLEFRVSESSRFGFVVRSLWPKILEVLYVK